jgi:hypothetical protein
VPRKVAGHPRKRTGVCDPLVLGSDRVVSGLAGTSVVLVLGVLVIAAFTYAPAPIVRVIFTAPPAAPRQSRDAAPERGL